MFCAAPVALNLCAYVCLMFALAIAISRGTALERNRQLVKCAALQMNFPLMMNASAGGFHDGSKYVTRGFDLILTISIIGLSAETI